MARLLSAIRRFLLNTEQPEPSEATPPQGFWRKWGVLIGFGVAVLAFFVAYDLWRERALNQPIAEPYQQLIDHLAAGSPGARAHLEAYRARFGQSFIRARHYEAVCAVMLRRAQRDGVDVGIVADRIGPGCGVIARPWRSDELPPR